MSPAAVILVLFLVAAIVVVRHRAQGGKPGAAAPSPWKVAIDGDAITLVHPAGLRETVSFAALKHVVLRTTDQGPLVDDMFWLLEDDEREIVVPSGAEGADALLEKLQSLPGFDNEAVIAASASTDNALIPCWKRTGGG